MAKLTNSKSLWILMLLALVASTTISSVLSTSEPSGDSGEVVEDWDEGFDDDYASEDDSSEASPQDQYALNPPPTSYPQPVPPPVQYAQVPPAQHYAPAPQNYPPMHHQQSYEHQANYTTVVELVPVAPVYQPVAPAPVYPVPLAQTYQQAQLTYPQPAQPAYQAPQQTYQQPSVYQAQYPQPQQTYSASNYSALPPAPVPVPVPVPVVTAKPSYAPVPVLVPAPVPVPTYSPAYVKPATNYTAPVVTQYQQQPRPQYTASSLAQKYSLADLAPYTSPFGYRSNHWTLHYYRFLNRPVCPRPGNYYRAPTYKEIESAFAQAIASLRDGYNPSGGVQYLNMSTPSFAARHQIASYLAGKNARMDEEGLLVEFVSLYLADRLCLTKWDRQRYLPSVTKFVSSGNFPQSHSCSQYYAPKSQQQSKNCYASKYRTYDGFCNNPYHPYWGKADVCHIRLLSPDYADGISMPREAHNHRYELPNPRLVANTIHSDVPLEGPYNLMKMQWGQFINHDISNTALSAYDGLVDCCKSRNARGCWPIRVLPGDRFYGPLNITCLNFIRSGVCPTCQLGPRQQTNKNTAFLDASHVYGNSHEQANQLRAFVGGLMKTSSGKNGEQLLPISNTQEQCFGVCYKAGDTRANQHPALTALHVLLVRNHNRHAQALAKRHPDWNDEYLFQEARRINTAEYQMITYAEYLPIVFGPILSAYYKLTPQYAGHTYYNPHVDPTTWNEYTTAACRFGHSQISSLFSLTTRLLGYDQHQKDETFRLKDWFFRPSLLADGKTQQILSGLLGRPALAVDPWVTNDVRNYLYKSPKEHSGGDLAATNIWRGRDHGLPGYVHYVEYCFNHKVRGWKDLALFIPPYALNQMRKLYRVVENIDLFTGGLSERHFPGADIGPTFACINGLQYYHLKFGDRYYFEHGGQAGSFNPAQLEELRRSSLAKLLCRAGYLPNVPQYAFMQTSNYNPLVNCSHVGEFNYNLF